MASTAPTPPELAAEIGSVAHDLPAYLAAPLFRRRHQRWGATPAEVAQALPGDDLFEESRHDRQASAHRGGRHAAGLARHCHRLQRPAPAAADTLRGDKPQDISGPDLIRATGGDRVSTNPVPRGLPTRREWSRPGQGVPLVSG